MIDWDYYLNWKKIQEDLIYLRSELKEEIELEKKKNLVLKGKYVAIKNKIESLLSSLAEIDLDRGK